MEEHIKTVLTLSKQIIKCKKLLLKLKQTLATACTLRTPLPSHNCLKELISEAERRIREFEKPVTVVINLILTASGKGDFRGRGISHISSTEMKDGYILLKDKNILSQKEATHVLFLSKYNNIRPGDILIFEECESFLMDIPTIPIDQ